MAELLIDCTGLSCPQPVLVTKNAIEKNEAKRLKIVVDNFTSKENVSRFARNQQWEVSVLEKGQELYELTLTRSAENIIADQEPETKPFVSVKLRKTLIYLGSNMIGSGDAELGIRLMRGFLRTLLDSEPKPWRMIFINSGVKLATIDDEATEALALLEEKGVEILSCGTCLEQFNLQDKLCVGRVTNMFEVINSLNEADKVISPN